MKKLIISISLLYYITFFHQWNFVESQPEKAGSTTPDSDGSTHTPSVSHVTLNIQRTECTNEYNFNDRTGLFTFKPNDNHLFTKVVEGTNDIWESNNNVYSTLVMCKTVDNVKYLSLLLKDNMFKLFHQDEDGTWNDLTSDRHDPSKLKFLGDNDAPLRSSDFEVTLQDLSYTILFNTDVKCRKITYNDNPLWTPTDDPDYSSIRSLHLDLLTNKFSVTNTSNNKNHLEIKLALDLNASQSTSEFEYTDENGLVTYTPKDDHVFNKISDDTTVIWESKDNVHGTEVMFIEGAKYLVVLLTNNMFKLFHEEGNKWHDITSKRHDITNLKFFKDNNTELSPSDYTVSLSNFSYKYIFNTGIKCKKIKYGDAEVWKHNDDPKYSEIKSFSLGLASNQFFVFNNTKSKILEYKPIPET